MIFKKDAAEIGPITIILRISLGVYAINGGYTSQSNEWNVTMAS